MLSRLNDTEIIIKCERHRFLEIQKKEYDKANDKRRVRVTYGASDMSIPQAGVIYI